MTIPAARQAMINHLVTMTTSAAIVLPDDPEAGAKGLPRYVVQDAGAAADTFDLGGRVEADVMISVNVETEAGQYPTANDALVAALCTRFRPGTRIGTPTVATIVQPPNPRPAIVGDGVYTVPVLIRGWTNY